MHTETVRLTMAQALIRFLSRQFVSRDGVEQPFFAGCFGIFGHGNVSGIGQALHEEPNVPNFVDGHKGPRLIEGMVLCI